MPATELPESPSASSVDVVPGPPEGIVVVDKPVGWTSHDVVSRMRRLAGTRRVGHAGTLDPMATGVLVVGIGRATRLLGYISGSDKTYAGTIRLGWSTVTDDAEGQRLDGRPADQVPLADLIRAVGDLTGAIMQRPSAVSAIKVAGRRSHDRVRSGEDVELPARPVVVSDFEVLEVRRLAELAVTDLDVVVTCSSGTYIRALARDLGAALAVGGHLTSLRRLRVGGFELDRARSLEELAVDLEVIDMPTVARMAFPSLALNAADANAVRYGRPIELGSAWAHALEPSAATPLSSRGSAPDDTTPSTPPAAEHADPPYALFATDGQFLALAERRPDGSTRYLAVFAQPE